MTTGAGKLTPFAARIFCAGKRMFAHRVPLGHALKTDMTADTEVIDGLVQLKSIITRMGIVTRRAAVPVDNPVAVKARDLFDGFLFIRMTGNTHINPGISPELERIPVPVGIVADRTVSDGRRSMNIGHGFQFSFIDMAPVAGLAHAAWKDADFFVAVTLAVAGHAVQIGRRTVHPLALRGQLTVA